MKFMTEMNLIKIRNFCGYFDGITAFLYSLEKKKKKNSARNLF